METVADRPKKLIIRSKMQSSNAILVEIETTAPAWQIRLSLRGFLYYEGKGQWGWGLSVCRSIVEAHGGQLGISPSQGPGTTFFFTLPLGTSQPE